MVCITVTMPMGTDSHPGSGRPSLDPMAPEAVETLNPTQRRTLEILGAGSPTEDRPATPDDLADQLRERLEDGLAPVAARLTTGRPLTITKHLLSGVHGCQARFLDDERRPFAPSVATVRGTVTHKALELGVNWPTLPYPGDLVDHAMASLERTGSWAAEFLADATVSERAELRGNAVELVAKFLECWPPLTVAMRPSTESRILTELCDRKILLKGQVDLTLGQPVASGNRARKIIVDHKTGGFSPDHAPDLRFYALVETLRTGVPPRLLVTSYLDAGTSQVETVTIGILEATVQRVIDGAAAYDALRTGTAEPVRRPSSACRWCALRDECPTGQSFLEEHDEHP